jgi:hypothetical protein
VEARVFDKQLSPDDVTTYEVASQLLNRRIGQLLDRSQACTDPADRRRLAASGPRSYVGVTG